MAHPEPLIISDMGPLKRWPKIYGFMGFTGGGKKKRTSIGVITPFLSGGGLEVHLEFFFAFE